MAGMEIEPSGTYRPAYRLRWRGLVRALDRFPRLKARLADGARRILQKVFEPGMVTTERVIEYPFIFQNLDGVAGPILDIGCVHSRLPIALASRGYAVVGLDFLPYPYRHPNLRSVRGDAMRTPFAAGSFGAVLAISVIEHVGLGYYGDPAGGAGDRGAVREIARILRPGGRAIITVPFGRAMTDGFKRVYDAQRLRELLAPLTVLRGEYAWSRVGLWMPCTEAEAISVDWNGPDRAVALVVAGRPSEPHRAT
jgi:SAM-dependent methyltransferase